MDIHSPISVADIFIFFPGALCNYSKIIIDHINHSVYFVSLLFFLSYFYFTLLRSYLPPRLTFLPSSPELSGKLHTMLSASPISQLFQCWHVPDMVV